MNIKTECCVGSVEQCVKNENGQETAETYQMRNWRFERRGFLVVKHEVIQKLVDIFVSRKS